MRIYLNTSPNRKPIPFNYQPKLVGTFHKWLGPNTYHDQMSLYSLSWLSPGNRVEEGLDYPDGAHFFISAPGTELIQQVISGIYKDPSMFAGMRVEEVIMRPTPEFEEGEAYFYVQSPVLIKRKVVDNLKYYFPQDEAANELLTETLTHKLRLAGLDQLTLSLQFDPGYRRSKTKVCTYNGIKNKGSIHPVIATGDPQAIAFAWETGLGNSTGIGFGAVK